MRRFVLAVQVAILTPHISAAEEDAVAKFYSFLPDQILSMTDEERSSSVPMMYIGAANLAAAPYGDLVIQSNLNVLMYHGLADYAAATKAFQIDLGDEPTGELTVGQIHQLGYRAERSNLTEVSFFPYDFGGSMLRIGPRFREPW